MKAILEQDELDVLRLVYLEALSQEKTRVRMWVSRGTVWRLLKGARRKVAQSLTGGRRLILSSEATG